MIKRKSEQRAPNKAARESKSIADAVARDIKLAYGLTTRSLTHRGRLIAFRTMHLKVSNAILHFGEYVEIVSLFDDSRRGPLVTLHFCAEEFVAALWALSTEAQAALQPDLATLRSSHFLRHAA